MRTDVSVREMLAKTKDIRVDVKLRYNSDNPAYSVIQKCKQFLDWVESGGAQIGLDLPESNSVIVHGADLRVDQPEQDDEIGSLAMEFPLSERNGDAARELFTRMERGERFKVTFVSLGEATGEEKADIEEEIEVEEEAAAV